LSDEDFYLSGEIQRLQYMPAQHIYRLTFDIYEQDTPKVKALVGREQLPIKIIIVDENE